MESETKVWTGGVWNRSAEERCSQVLANIRDGLIEVDRGLVVRYASERAVEILYRELSTQLLGLHLDEVFDLFALSDEYRLFRDLAAGGAPFPKRLELVVRRGDGMKVALVIRPFPIESDEGLQGIGLVIANVTRQQKVERAFRKGQSLLVTMLWELPVLVVARDEKNQLVFWNHECERTSGYSSDEVYADPDAASLIYKDPATCVTGAAEGEQGSGRLRDFEQDITCKDGSVRTISWIAISDTIRVPGWSSWEIGFDVTERKNTELELGRALLRDESGQRPSEPVKADQEQRAKRFEALSRFAGGVAHGFNNLLTSISCSAEFLAEEIPSYDPVSEYVAEIRLAVDQAVDLTSQILAVSRQKIPVSKRIDVRKVVGEMSQRMQERLGEDIELVVRCLDVPSLVQVDRQQLVMVFDNLAGRAHVTMATGGRLGILVRNVDFANSPTHSHGTLEPGPYVLVEVTDTSSGMGQGTISKVFEPFARVEDLTSGTGMEMSVIYGIVSRAGGLASVRSDPKKGTTLLIYLPRSPEDGESELDRKRYTLPPLPRGRETILLLEDEIMVRRSTTRALERAGHEVLAASSGEEALKIVEAHDGPIHLLLSDVVMPGMSGPEVVKMILQRHPEAAVCYMSGYTDDTLTDQFRLEDLKPFLAKPFTPSELLESVRKILDGSNNSP